MAAQLQNPHIVPLLSAGEGDGLLFYTMPLVAGESLRARLVRDGELPVADAVRVMRDVAKALAYAHRNGVVHRDIKPENILLSDDEALVADFGVAKALSASATRGGGGLTSIGMALGTPAYMAPEQAFADQSADHRVDLYALGAVAYEMLTGQGMFPGRSPQALVAAHSTETPEPIERRRPSSPPPLAALVMRLIAKRPADRPQSADDVVRELDAITVGGGSGITMAHTGAETPRSGRRRVWRLAGATAAVLIIGGGAMLAVRRARRIVAPAALPAATQAAIAVLPFLNMSGDKENEYFSDGMTEELINRLANVRGMRVVARTSAFAFKGKEVDVREIGRQLGVHSVVEGSVRRSGSQVRVTAQLIDADSGYHRWSQAYDGDVKDVFAVQQQISTAIASELQLVLAGNESAALARAPTRDTAAHRLYLEGLFYWNKRAPAALKRAIQRFREAIVRDSNYADAYAGLASVYVVMPFYLNISFDSTYGPGLESAHAALALDSTLSAPHAVLMLLLAGRYEWEAALHEGDRALTLAPNDAITHHWRGDVFLRSGRLDEGLNEARRAVELDPLAAINRNDLGSALHLLHRDVEAEAEIRRALEIDPELPPAWSNLGLILLATGRGDSAVAAMRHGLGFEQPDPTAGSLGVLGRALALTGHRDSALALRHQLETRAQRSYISPAAVALIDLGLGDRDRAFANLIRAADAHDLFLADAITLSDRAFDGVRADSRFAKIKRRMKLPP